jgi:uncharacterized protein
MTENSKFITDVAFSHSVKKTQERLGSREAMARLEQSERWLTTITPDLAKFLQMRTSIYLSSASADGQPYLQHRGGPPGFIRIIDDKTLELDDYPGNGQYITNGNLAENNRAFIFAMDYEQKQRIKLWGRAKFVDLDQPKKTYGPIQVIRLFRFELEAWDVNCKSHLPDFYRRETVELATKKMATRIAELEAEVAKLQQALNN